MGDDTRQWYAVRCTARIVLQLSPDEIPDDRAMSQALMAANGHPWVGIGGPFVITPVGVAPR